MKIVEFPRDFEHTARSYRYRGPDYRVEISLSDWWRYAAGESRYGMPPREVTDRTPTLRLLYGPAEHQPRLTSRDSNGTEIKYPTESVTKDDLLYWLRRPATSTPESVVAADYWREIQDGCRRGVETGKTVV